MMLEPKSSFLEHHSKSHIEFVFCVFFIAIATWYFQRIGFADSPDSGWYLLVADSFSQGLFERNPRFAPLYSYCLGTLKFLGLNFHQALTVYLGLTFAAFFFIGNQIIKNIPILILFFVAIFLNAPTYEAFHRIWTEVGYSLFMFIATVGLLRMVTRSSNFSYLVILSACALPVQRYIGGYLSLYLGLLYIFFDLKSSQIIRRFLWMVVAAIPATTLILMNYLSTETIAGNGRDPATYSIRENTTMLLGIFRHYFSYEMILYAFAIVYTASLVARKKVNLRYFLIFLIPLVQMLAQIHSSSTYKFDDINPRFVILVIPTVYLLILLSISNALNFETLPRISESRVKHSVYLILIAMLTIGSFFVKEKHFKRVYGESNRRQFLGIKNAISSVPIDSKIAFYFNPIIRTIPWVELPRMVPDHCCQHYKQIKPITDQHLTYIPTCKLTGGPQFVSVGNSKGNIMEHFDYFLFVTYDKNQAGQSERESWLSSLKDYEMILDMQYMFFMKRKHSR